MTGVTTPMYTVFCVPMRAIKVKYALKAITEPKMARYTNPIQ